MENDELSKLSIADLVALDTFLERRKEEWEKHAKDLSDNPNAVSDSEEHFKVCNSIQEDVRLELRDRISAINSDYEI